MIKKIMLTIKSYGLNDEQLKYITNRGIEEMYNLAGSIEYEISDSDIIIEQSNIEEMSK